MRGGSSPETLIESCRVALSGLDPDLPFQGLMTAQQAVARELRGISVLGQILAGFAFVGLLLAATGIYGLLNRLVTRRTPEIGVRIVYGARPWDVIRLVSGAGLQLVVLGITLGLVGTAVIASLSESAESDLPSMLQPTTLAPIALILAITAMLASYLPALRATRISPSAALRAE